MSRGSVAWWAVSVAFPYQIPAPKRHRPTPQQHKRAEKGKLCDNAATSRGEVDKSQLDNFLYGGEAGWETVVKGGRAFWERVT